MSSPTFRFSLFIGLIALVAAACGGTPSADSTSTTAASTSTTTTTTTSTTTTVPTTTTMAPVEVTAEEIHQIFNDYIAAIVNKDWTTASSLSTGSAADYVGFVEDLDAVSPQPDWQFDTASDPDCCDVVEVDSERRATAASLVYQAPDGSGTLATDSPVINIGSGQPLLEYWGEDLNDEGKVPSLAQRIKNLSFSEFDPASCTSDGSWAYIPGSTDTSVEVTIVLVANVCDVNSDVTPDPSRMTLFTADGSTNVTASTVLWEDGPNAIPAGERRFFLAIYLVPQEVAMENLFAGVGFTPASGANYSFTIEVGPFPLDG